MTTDISNIGHNAASELEQRAAGLCELLDKIADLQEEVKIIKAEMKSNGFDMKAVNQIIKELRRDEDYRAAQLELELVVDTYRQAVGLPTNFEAAQDAAREAATTVPAGRIKAADKSKLN